MKTIPLTQGMVTLVNTSDYVPLSKYNWCAWRGGKRSRKYYAARRSGNRVVFMHRELLGLGVSRLKGEHKDGDSLNNRRKNLRVATQLQNRQAFILPRPNKTSKFRGVFRDTEVNKWKSVITVCGKKIYLGRFFDEVKAARVYDAAAKKYFGEFACPNFK